MCFEAVSFSLPTLPPEVQTTITSLPGEQQQASIGPLLPLLSSTYLHFPLSNQSTFLKHVHVTIWLLPTSMQGLSKHMEEKSNPSEFYKALHSLSPASLTPSNPSYSILSTSHPVFMVFATVIFPDLKHSLPSLPASPSPPSGPTVGCGQESDSALSWLHNLG